jgi:hypothetical protein
MSAQPPQRAQPGFEINEVPPADLGKSPFRARGVFFDRVTKAAAGSPGGIPAFLEQIKDDRVRTFAGQNFHWPDWYDALAMVPMQAALCRLQGGDFETLVRKRARAAGEDLVPRIFRMLLKLGSPKAAATHVPRLLDYYFDFVETAIDVSDSEGVGIMKHIPRMIAPGFVNTALGLIEGGLHLMGARRVNGSYSEVTRGAPLHGFETIDCKLTFHWVK